MQTVETADPSTPLRSGRDDTFCRANFRLGTLEALCWESVGGFGDDDPEDEIRDRADAGEQSHERRDDADDVDVPTVVESEAGADPGNHAVVAWPRELVGVWVIAGRRRRGC